MTSFETCKQYGLQGEADVNDWLQTLPGIANIEDVSDNKFYQDMDIDLFIDLEDGQEIAIEIKTDSLYKTGNFFLETISNDYYGTAGCIVKTQSDYVFYYYPGPGKLYVLPTLALQQWISDNQHRYTPKKTKLPGNLGQYYSIGLCVPREVLMNEVGGARCHVLH
ncbi:MAG: hypothetical protein CVU90_01965 [Firmicutes bacterium HGW-Firmicutes-15]|nr:MAG: hypothetical protein CVU90_01965 [Firmicutes bacterium HGW-Firmicutes-15]